MRLFVITLVTVNVAIAAITGAAILAANYANPDIGRGLHPAAAVIFAAVMAALAIASINNFTRKG